MLHWRLCRADPRPWIFPSLILLGGIITICCRREVVKVGTWRAAGLLSRKGDSGTVSDALRLMSSLLNALAGFLLPQGLPTSLHQGCVFG